MARHPDLTCRPFRTPEMVNRRQFLQHAGAGVGMLALAGLLARSESACRRVAACRTTLAETRRTLLRRRKSVIWLFMEGGPSGFDLFDYKPELQKRNGQRVDGIETHFGNPGPLLASPYSFKQYGQSGALVLRKVFDPSSTRRRHRANQELLGGVAEPRAGDVSDEHGNHSARFPERRLVGDLRAGDREPEPSQASS